MRPNTRNGRTTRFVNWAVIGPLPWNEPLNNSQQFCRDMPVCVIIWLQLPADNEQSTHARQVWRRAHATPQSTGLRYWNLLTLSSTAYRIVSSLQLNKCSLIESLRNNNTHPHICLQDEVVMVYVCIWSDVNATSFVRITVIKFSGTLCSQLHETPANWDIIAWICESNALKMCDELELWVLCRNRFWRNMSSGIQWTYR